MALADTERIATRSRFALGVAVASLVCTFAFSIPLLTYLGEGLFLAHDVPLPKALGLCVRASPWLPGSIAVLGSLGLLMKEGRMRPVGALRWNWAAVFAVALFGGFLLFVCITPLIVLLFNLNHRNWW
jgi:hypothetical protein